MKHKSNTKRRKTLKNEKNVKVSGKCIHDGHRKRLINTVNKVGLDNLSDVQALEYILFLIFPRGDVNPLAHRLLDRFGHVSTVLEADIEDLKMVEGMGETSAMKLHSLLEIFYYYSLDKGRVSHAKTSGELYDRFEQMLRYRGQEEVYIIGISPRGEATSERKIAEGNFSEVNIDIKDIALYLTTYKVTSVIIVHNHPNGNCLPSPADFDTTEKFREMFKFVGCKIQDSLIVGIDGIYSIVSKEVVRRFKVNEKSKLQSQNQDNPKKMII